MAFKTRAYRAGTVALTHCGGGFCQDILQTSGGRAGCPVEGVVYFLQKIKALVVWPFSFWRDGLFLAGLSVHNKLHLNPVLNKQSEETTMFQAIHHRALVGALLAVGLTLPTTVLAVTSTTYSFVGVTNNNAANVATGVASLSVEVIDLNATQVGFKFTNSSSSSLTDVYFDDGTLLGIAGITDSGSTVDFSAPASPANLPGGSSMTVPFETTQNFSADSNPPTSPNGVTSGEWLTITFNLQSGQNYDSIINALALPNGGGTGDLRIGLHVQSFPGGGSESFVNSPDAVFPPVPEPETYAMMLAGLGGGGFMARRRLV